VEPGYGPVPAQGAARSVNGPGTSGPSNGIALHGAPLLT